jgi:hypothetical protein
VTSLSPSGGIPPSGVWRVSSTGAGRSPRLSTHSQASSASVSATHGHRPRLGRRGRRREQRGAVDVADRRPGELVALDDGPTRQDPDDRGEIGPLGEDLVDVELVGARGGTLRFCRAIGCSGPSGVTNPMAIVASVPKGFATRSRASLPPTVIMPGSTQRDATSVGQGPATVPAGRSSPPVSCHVRLTRPAPPRQSTRAPARRRRPRRPQVLAGEQGGRVVRAPRPTTETDGARARPGPSPRPSGRAIASEVPVPSRPSPTAQVAVPRRGGTARASGARGSEGSRRREDVDRHGQREDTSDPTAIALRTPVHPTTSGVRRGPRATGSGGTASSPGRGRSSGGAAPARSPAAAPAAAP